MLYRRVPEAQWRGASLDILRNLGLDGRYSHFPSQLSGGEQQRVAIARAVAVAPDMILADEPTGSLDSRASAEILTLLQKLNRQGLTVILVTHDELVARVARRIVRLRDGAIIDDETIRDGETAPETIEAGRAESSPWPTTLRQGPAISFATNVRIALRLLRVHRLRSALTMLGIVIGVAAVITMVAVADGAQEQIAERMRSLGANLLLVRPGTQTDKGVRLQAGSRRNLSEDDAAAIGNEIPEVVVAAPFMTGRGRVVAGNNNWSTTIAGITPDYMVAREWEVDEGEVLSIDHQKWAAKVVLIGRTVAESLFGAESPLGKNIRIGNAPFTVIGLLRKKGQNASGQDQDDVVMMPLSTTKVRVLGRGLVKPRSVHAILVKVYAHHVMADAEREIRLLLRQRHRLLLRKDDDFTVQNLTELMETRKEAFRQFTLLVAVLASVSLIVGGIGIMNIMLVSVTERTRENGLRLAVGARPRDLGNQYLTEAVTLSLIGGLLGVAVGLGTASVITRLVDWPTLFRPGVMIMAIGFSVAVGLLFGLYPALKASRLNPIEALRLE